MTMIQITSAKKDKLAGYASQIMEAASQLLECMEDLGPEMGERGGYGSRMGMRGGYGDRWEAYGDRDDYRGDYSARYPMEMGERRYRDSRGRYM